MKKKNGFFSMLAIVVGLMLIFVFAGCNNNDDGGETTTTPSSTTTPASNTDISIFVNNPGEAWVSDSDGYIFHSDGTYEDITLIWTNFWDSHSTSTDKSYSRSGNTLIINWVYESWDGIASYSITYTFSISGDTLTLTNDAGNIITYKRQSVSLGFSPPLNHTPLTENNWLDHSSSSIYSFNVNEGTTYNIWALGKTKNMSRSSGVFYYENGNRVNYNMGARRNQTFTATSDGKVYILFYHTPGLDDTYQIVYSTNTNFNIGFPVWFNQ